MARPKDLQYNKVISEKGYPLMKQYTPEELNKLSKEEIVSFRRLNLIQLLIISKIFIWN